MLRGLWTVTVGPLALNALVTGRVTVLGTHRINDYITHRNGNAEPFVWTATADEILAKVRFVQANIKKLLDNNAK